MTDRAASYHGYRFPPEIISHAVWLYHRFCVSFRDTEDLLAQRAITVSYEAIRQWCRTFGPAYARRLRRRKGRLGDTWHLDELFVNIQGRQQYLWRAIDQDGDVIDILVQPRRDRRAAECFFRKLLKGQGRVPRRLITDKLRSYSAARSIVMPSVVHSTQQYENNRARSLSSADPPTRATDAEVQIRRACATFSLGARTRSESLSRGTSPATGCSLPAVENPLLPCVARRDLRLLKTDERPTSKNGHAISSST
jgi:putative transposase